MKLVFTVLIVLLASVRAFSQTYSTPSDGKDFWVGYMYPSYNKVANPGVEAFYGAFLLISSYTDNRVSVFYFSRINGIETQAGQYSILARTGIQIPIQLLSVKMQDSGDLPEFAAIHITAKRAIHVEFFSTGACSGGSFMAIQTPLLGKKYVIESYTDNPGNGGIISAEYPPSGIEISHGFFEIICPSDSTKITITPTVKTMGGHSGITGGTPHPYTILLQRAQCYLVKSAGMTSDFDISGSIVESDKPVAVIAGHAFLGSVNGAIMDGRNFMVQQMLPLGFWDSTGYVSVPLKGSQPADQTRDGYGENFRLYSDDINGVASVAKKFNTINTIQLPTAAYSHSEITNIGDPIEFHSTDQKNFSVMMYDLRDFANSAPYPAPSMMTIIPISRWKTSYLWYVPANKFQTLQDYYANIIGLTADMTALTGGIMASFNGGPIRPLPQVLTSEQQFTGIPNHPELTANRFKLSPGSYYATGPHPFIVYNYGFRALDPNFDIGDFDGEDHFFSYGSPAGFAAGGGLSAITATIDTSCASWRICIHDSSLNGMKSGIKSIELMDDPNGDQFEIHPGKQFLNTRLDDSLDPDRTGSIILSGNDTNFCFNVLVNHPIDSAYAPLFIANDQGGAKLLELHYYPPSVRINADTGTFLGLALNKDSCIKFVLRNTANPNSNNLPFKVNSAALRHNTSGFTITSIVPKLPVSLHAGDSLVITTCYIAKDTNLRIDTLSIGTDCFSDPIPLAGSGAIPIIWASNHDFGSVLVDSTKYDTVGVYNIGQMPFTLNSKWFMSNYGASLNFRLEPSDSIKLVTGITLSPGQKYLFHFCYTPTTETLDSATQHWGTTLQPPFQHSIKDTSLLLGKGVKTGFVWDRVKQDFAVDSVGSDTLTIRVYLYNNSSPGGPPAHVDNISIIGPDAAEFIIIGNTAGFVPLNNFDLYPAPAPNGQLDSIGVDVLFKPKGVPPDFQTRHAQLVAHGESQKDVVIDLIGLFIGKSTVKLSMQSFFTIRPNPANGNVIIIDFSQMDGRTEVRPTVIIFDVLGREVYRKEISQGIGPIEAPIGNLPNGSYYARISRMPLKKFEILR